MKKVALIYGGFGAESAVSKVTAQAFAKALDELRVEYEYVEANPELPKRLLEIKPKLALLAGHGKYAEDGTLQGRLGLLGWSVYDLAGGPVRMGSVSRAGYGACDGLVSPPADSNGRGFGPEGGYPSGPSGWGVAIAQMYASTDVNWFLENNRKMREEPGTFPEYRSVNTQMLGLIVQKITGQRLADAFSERVWQKVGADFTATWNVDHVGGYEKAFCCFNATARDYARVGQALMSGDPKIASTSWKARLSTSAVTLDYGWGYGAQMWHPFPGVNLMMGLHGQYIYMDALNDTVIVKLSDIPTSSDGISAKIAPVLREIAEKN